MIRYQVSVKAYLPYSIEKSYTIMASNYPVAIRRAVDQWKKEDRIKRKRIDTVFVKADRLVQL